MVTESGRFVKRRWSEGQGTWRRKVAKMTAAAAVNIQSKALHKDRSGIDVGRAVMASGDHETSWAVQTRRTGRSVFQKPGSVTSEKGESVHLMGRRR
jgi:hypothetical protein